ncbi:MAG: hypothetical protein GX558_09955 [Clostridiales bacterium]|nr:hypothetical protein [Clostridiales bacterium]
MDVFEALRARHSYRGRYLNAPVPREHLDKIALAGVQAPSGCNGQTTRFVIVDDPDMAARVRARIDMDSVNTAPAFIVVVSEKRATYGDTDFEIEDCSAAVENMLLAITALGYASVWLDGVLREDGIGDDIARAIGMPEGQNLTPRVLLPIGVPAEKRSQNSRKPWGERVFYNGMG